VTQPSYFATSSIVVSPDQESLNRKAAEYLVGAAREAIEARGRFAIALAGGSTPKPLYEMLASPSWRTQIDWGNVHVFWGDERLVPADHPDSNYRMVNAALLSKVPVVASNVHRVPTERGDPDAVAAAYEKTILQDFNASAGEIPRFDVSVLGLGANGHTASLFPHTKSLTENRKLVMAEFVQELDQYRVTMTLPLINHSRNIVFLVSGAGKASVVKEVIGGPSDPQRLPAQLIRPDDGTLVWMLDKAAAAELPARS
jgi:6-phosphogluconolactonase